MSKKQALQTIQEFYKMDPDAQREKMQDLGVRSYLCPHRQLVKILQANESESGGGVFSGGQIGVGFVDLHHDGYGFLRRLEEDYNMSDSDFYLPAHLVSKYKLRPGDGVIGSVKNSGDQARQHPPLKDIWTVNGQPPSASRPCFEELTPLYPEKRFSVETSAEKYTTRIVDLFTPIGMGQRGLIVAPPRTGKTMLLQDIANGIAKNSPGTYVIILLIDERPEEVTDMERNVCASEVASSTFDRGATRHVHVSKMVLNRAKRLVETGEDVVILLDSITRLARAHNLVASSTGKVLSGGIDSQALQKPKQFFGAARNIEAGGSLTIVATALVDTGSKMDDVIFEEFKGTGNMELCLSRKLANQRKYPAVDFNASGTRKEEYLLSADVLGKLMVLREAFARINPAEALPLVKDKLAQTKNNQEFLSLIQV